jgi:hypothetical protein
LQASGRENCISLYQWEEVERTVNVVKRVEMMVLWKEFRVSLDTTCVFLSCIHRDGESFGAGCALVPCVMRYRRLCADGIDALLVAEPLRWRVQLRFRQQDERAAFSLVGLYAPTLGEAQALADWLLRDHVGNGECLPWELFDLHS